MAGPLLRLSMRNWMPVASMARAMAPPRASISRTICPLPTPPMAGLQLIWAMVSRLLVKQCRFRAHPRSGQRGLRAGVPAADHQDVEIYTHSSHAPVKPRPLVAVAIVRPAECPATSGRGFT